MRVKARLGYVGSGGIWGSELEVSGSRLGEGLYDLVRGL